MELSWEQLKNVASQLAEMGWSFEDIINKFYSQGIDINSHMSQSMSNPREALLKFLVETYPDWDMTQSDETTKDYEPQIFSDEEIEKNKSDFEQNQISDEEYNRYNGDNQSSEETGITLRPRSLDEILSFRVSLDSLDENGGTVINGKWRKLTNMNDYYDLQRELVTQLHNFASQTGNQKLADETYNFIRNERSGKLLSPEEEIESNELNTNFYQFNLQRQKEKEERESRGPKKQESDNYLWGPKESDKWKSNGDGTSSFGDVRMIVEKSMKSITKPILEGIFNGLPNPQQIQSPTTDQNIKVDKEKPNESSQTVSFFNELDNKLKKRVA